MALGRALLQRRLTTRALDLRVPRRFATTARQAFNPYHSFQVEGGSEWPGAVKDEPLFRRGVSDSLTRGQI